MAGMVGGWMEKWEPEAASVSGLRLSVVHDLGNSPERRISAKTNSRNSLIRSVSLPARLERLNSRVESSIGVSPGATAVPLTIAWAGWLL